MGNEHNGCAVQIVQAANEFEHFPASCRIQSRRRLIEHQNLRLHRHNASQRDAAFLSAGQLKRRFVAQTDIQSDIFHRLRNTPLDLCGIQSHIGWTIGDILANCFFKQLIFRILEHQSDAKAHTANIAV